MKFHSLTFFFADDSFFFFQNDKAPLMPLKPQSCGTAPY